MHNDVVGVHWRPLVRLLIYYAAIEASGTSVAGSFYFGSENDTLMTPECTAGFNDQFETAVGSLLAGQVHIESGAAKSIGSI